MQNKILYKNIFQMKIYAEKGHFHRHIQIGTKRRKRSSLRCKMGGTSFIVGEISSVKLGQLGNLIYIATILDGARITLRNWVKPKF